jgi:hypothetical protein
VVVVLLWLAAVLNLVRKAAARSSVAQALSVVVLPLAIPSTVQNYVNFCDLNTVIQTIHLFPLERATFHWRMKALPAVVAFLPPGSAIPIELVADRAGLMERFYSLSKSVLGVRSTDADRHLAHFVLHPIGTEAYVRAYVRAFYPRRTVDRSQ